MIPRAVRRLSKIKVPFLSASNIAGFDLHPRGNFEAFMHAVSTQKWLEIHPGGREEWFYLDKPMECKGDSWITSSKESPMAVKVNLPFTSSSEDHSPTLLSSAKSHLGYWHQQNGSRLTSRLPNNLSPWSQQVSEASQSSTLRAKV